MISKHNALYSEFLATKGKQKHLGNTQLFVYPSNSTVVWRTDNFNMVSSSVSL